MELRKSKKSRNRRLWEK